MAEKITESIQQEFANRVLRPEIAEKELERITNQTVEVYMEGVKSTVSEIGGRYDVSPQDWEHHLDKIAIMTYRVEGNREVPLTLKALVTGTGISAVKGTALLGVAVKAVVEKIGAKAAAKGAGKAAGKLAAKTGSKVAAKLGGKFLGVIVGVGILIWDVWDHYKTREEQEPILRRNLNDYLAELRAEILHDPEAGIMSVIGAIESKAIESLPGIDKGTAPDR